MRIRHVERFKDRHGKIRYYFRRKHGKRFALPGVPGSPEFGEAYQVALASSARLDIRYNHAPGTFHALADLYFKSTRFMRQRQSSQTVTRRIIERFIAEHGHRLVRQMTPAHIEIVIGQKSETPAAANNLLKKLRALIRFGIRHGYRDTDPTIGIEKFREGEHHTWTEEEITQFEAHWPLGTRQRTAFALHLYTGQRREDVCVMTWGDIAADRIRVVQRKTGERLSIPVHHELRRTLDAWPKRPGVLIYSRTGRRYAVAAYGTFMAKAIDATGLPERCVLHGLRKAAARRLAEAGCTEKQIASVTGHRTLQEITRYTRAASQEKLADAAIVSIDQFGKSAKKA